MAYEQFIAALRANVTFHQQDDGSWLCDCGERSYSKLDFWRHRQGHARSSTHTNLEGENGRQEEAAQGQ